MIRAPTSYFWRFKSKLTILRYSSAPQLGGMESIPNG